MAERKQRGIAMEGYWTRQSTNTRDRATAMMPRMLYDRLDELGIDFGVIYPTAGLGIPRIPDDETRRAVVRGFNIVTAEYFAKLSDRLTPAAVIPMCTPEEAIEELEFCTRQLGAKVGMFGGGFARRVPLAKDLDPALGRFAVTYENLGIDSDLRLRPGLAEMPRARHGAHLPCRRPRLWPAQFAQQFHLQPYRPFRGGRALRSPRACSWAA